MKYRRLPVVWKDLGPYRSGYCHPYHLHIHRDGRGRWFWEISKMGGWVVPRAPYGICRTLIAARVAAVAALRRILEVTP